MDLEYKYYYLRAIYRNQNGLKLVLGGTGLGKTHGMREAVKEYLQSDIEEKRKVIYITNRHNLIREQEKNFTDAGFKCSYLKRNPEIILELVKRNSLNEVLEELERLNYFRFDEQLRNKYKRDLFFKKLIDGIKQKHDLLTDEKEKKSTLQKTIKKDLESDCKEVFKTLKDQLINAGRNDEDFHKQLLANEFVWKVFPYVEFENSPDVNILLVTIDNLPG